MNNSLCTCTRNSSINNITEHNILGRTSASSTVIIRWSCICRPASLQILMTTAPKYSKMWPKTLSEDFLYRISTKSDNECGRYGRKFVYAPVLILALHYAYVQESHNTFISNRLGTPLIPHLSSRYQKYLECVPDICDWRRFALSDEASKKLETFNIWIKKMKPVDSPSQNAIPMPRTLRVSIVGPAETVCWCH